jgi:hypothetical protein
MQHFQIFGKYVETSIGNIGCEHDVLYIYCDHELVSEEDKARLEELGFRYKSEDEEEPGEPFEHGNFEYFV